MLIQRADFFRESNFKSNLKKIIDLILNRPSPLLNDTEVREIVDGSRPLTKAWFMIEKKHIDFRFKSDLLRLFIGFNVNLAPLGLLFNKIHYKLTPSTFYTGIQLTLSALGLMIVSTGLGIRRRRQEERAMIFLGKFSPELRKKIEDNKDLVSLFGPTLVLHYYSPNSIGFPSDFAEEIAGLVAIGGLGSVPLVWLEREDTLFNFCGLEEYLEKRLTSEEVRENYNYLKKGFEGSVDELIEVCKKI